MATINMKSVTKLVASNPMTRNAFKSGIQFALYLLEAQKLVDSRKLKEVTLDWERGTLNLGEGFLEQVAARAVSEYYVNPKRWASQNKSRVEENLRNQLGG